MLRRALTIGAALTALLVLTAGSCESRGTGDAPVDTRLMDETAPYIINMPDQFMNLALKCVGDDLIVAHTREAPPLYIPDADPCINDSEVPDVNIEIGPSSSEGEGSGD